MIRTILVTGASAFALALSAPALAQDDSVPAETPQMTFGDWGFDPAGLDPSIDPGDDFFNYVNGRWIAANPIPPEYGRFGAFTFLGEKSSVDVQVLIDELVAANPAPGSKERRIVDAFTAYLDKDAIDARGMAPAYPYLGAIFSASDLGELADLFATPAYASLVGAGVTIDAKDPESYAVSIGFSGMGLPAREMYLEDSEANLAIRAAYMELLTFMLGKAGYADPAAAAEAVYAFEHDVAVLEWGRSALRNRDLTYNKLTRAQVAALVPDFPLVRVLEVGGYGDIESFLVPQMPPDDAEAAELELTDEFRAAEIGGGFPAMMELLNETPLATLKAYLAVRFLSNNASVLPSDVEQADFAFYGQTLSGAEEQQVRWKRAITETEGLLGEVLGQTYSERYFPEASKDAMLDLVANLRASFAAGLDTNEWMSAETQARALEKLESFNTKIGYPDEFETYEGLEISADNPLANRISAADWVWQFDLGRLGNPVDKSEWFMLPQQVNAYYAPNFNEIVFPAAILQQPFFGPDVDPAVNYGAIGAVIGHEIGHGFDDQGSKYDGTGTLTDWWTEEDRAAFDALGDRLVEQYNQFCPLDDGELCVDGRSTLGENLGDIGGLAMAYRAYRMSLNGAEAPVLDGLTGDQRFFLSWAQAWRTTTRDEELRRRLLTDSHSPPRYRVNGIVRNMDEWYEAFGITEDDDLYLPPEERVQVW